MFTNQLFLKLQWFKFFCHFLLFYDHSTRSVSSYWAPEPRTSLRLSVFWWWFEWPHGTRSWTPGSTSCWGRLFWGKSSCCPTAAGAQSLTTYTAGSAVCSAARVLARLTAAASVDCLCQTLRSNPSPEPWSLTWKHLWDKQEEAVKNFVGIQTFKMYCTHHKTLICKLTFTKLVFISLEL